MSRLILGPREGWLTFLLLMAVVVIPAVSLADAGWVDDLWIVPRVAAAGVLLGLLLAKLPVRWPAAHLVGAVVGAAGIGFHFARMAPEGDWQSKFGWLWDRIWAWLQVVFGGGMGNDNMLFALLMALLAWSLGYGSSWLTFRLHNALIPVVVCASALLLNLSYGAPDPESYLLAFLMFSLLLMIRVTLFQREREWSSADASYSRGITWNSLWASTLLSAGLLSLAWSLPIGSVNAAVAESWYRVTGPWQGLQEEFDRLFASIGTGGGRVEGNRFSRTMALKGAIELGRDPVMLVSSPLPEYWAAQTYDQYNGHGWISSADQTSRLDANDGQLAATSLYRGRVDVEQRFKILVGRTSNVFAATSPVKLSLPVYADYFDSLEQLAAVRSTVPMRPGQQYAVVSSVSVATADQLRQAGRDYPQWTARYLELPRSPDERRVIALARRLAGGMGSGFAAAQGRRVMGEASGSAAGQSRVSDNPYDAAVAIQDYLRGLRYEVKVDAPPPDRDAVDWFLFTSREGYCDYFASAMAVMARAVGIPSRVVSGYNTGSFNERTGLYEVRQENAHSWPELFFPGFGWVRFEPTPTQPVPDRPLVAAADPDSTDPAAGEMESGFSDLDLGSRDRALYSDGFDLGGDPSAFDAAQESSAPESVLRWIAPLVGALLLVATLWAAMRLMLSRLSPPVRAYLGMYWTAGILGWRLNPSSTPMEYARLLSSTAPELGADLLTIARCYAEEIYGGRRASMGDRARSAWRRIRWRLPLTLLRKTLRRSLADLGFSRRSAR